MPDDSTARDRAEKLLTTVARFGERLRKQTNESYFLWDQERNVTLGLFLVALAVALRTADIGKSILVLIDRGRLVPAVSLCRTCLETVSVLSQVIDAVDSEEAVRVLRLALEGSSQRMIPEGSLRTADGIASLERRFPDLHFKRTYRMLCDIDHPNYPGLVLPYLDPELSLPAMRQLKLRNKIRGSLQDFALGTLERTVGACNHLLFEEVRDRITRSSSPGFEGAPGNQSGE